MCSIIWHEKVGTYPRGGLKEAKAEVIWTGGGVILDAMNLIAG